MTKDPAWLLNFQSNVFSQAGEDGIIEKVLSLLPERDVWCVEFGAWDGIHFSNTRNLILNKDYGAVLIEGDPGKFKELRANYSEYPKVTSFNKMVGFEGQNRLDLILAETSIPREFDFLSIDIDGNDYHVWKALENYAPKIICIEYNPTIPTPVHFVQPADMDINQGASVLALAELGREKGYELICVQPFNAFFTRKEYFPLFEIGDNSPGTLRKHDGVITYLFSGYDGTVFVRGYGKLNWHNIPIDENKVQILPKFLRKYPLNYTGFETFLFNLFFKKKKD